MVDKPTTPDILTTPSPSAAPPRASSAIDVGVGAAVSAPQIAAAGSIVRRRADGAALRVIGRIHNRAADVDARRAAPVVYILRDAGDHILELAPDDVETMTLEEQTAAAVSAGLSLPTGGQ